MTREDARKFTQLLNGIVVEAALIPERSKAGLRATARTLRLHASQLREVVNIRALVERDQTTARILNKLEAVIPEGSQAAGVLRLARAELRQRGMVLQERS